MDLESTSGPSSNVEMDSPFDSAAEPPPEKIESKRKGVHRNNEGTDSSSNLGNPTKRIKIGHTKPKSVRLIAKLGYLDEEVLDSPAALEPGMKKGEVDEGSESDEKRFHVDAPPRNNGEPLDEMESDNSNNSDKFYSQIKAKEEKGNVPFDSKTPQLGDNQGSATNLTDSTEFEDTSSNTQANASQPVQVFIKIINPSTNLVFFEAKNFKSDLGTMIDFLKKHEVDISNAESGYAADDSSLKTSSSATSASLGLRQNMSSLGSTIPRASDASTVSRPSVASEVQVHLVQDNLEFPELEFAGPRRLRRHDQSRKRGNRNLVAEDSRCQPEPLLSSTRTSEHLREDLEISTKYPQPTLKITKIEKLTQKREQVVKTRAGQKEEESLRASSISLTSSSNTSTGTSISVNIKVEPSESVRRKPRGLPRNGIASLKSVEDFTDSSFVKSATLWGSIGQDEAVFARWRDKSYYSGKILKKGMNDTWYILFEDDMEDVASETHILPIKIIGVGTWTVYCPPDEFKPENAIIVGQRFLDSTDDLENTEYAIVSDVDGRVIICFRKNLTLEESDAKEMRKDFQVDSTPKAADLSVDNIVSGRRRRGGTTSPPPSSLIRKLVADLESAKSDSERTTIPINFSMDTNTPTTSRKVSKVPTKLITTRSVSTTSEDSGSYIPPSELTSTDRIESEDVTQKDEDTEIVKLFEGMEFFLTASGGTNQTTSGSPTAYDKDEFRRLILASGGVLVEAVGDEAVDGKNVFLISDNYARTVKYIYALAAGIPCISYNWITECLLQARIIDYQKFELSSGFSIETKLVTPAHRQKPLKGVRVYVTGATDELYKYWKPVLTAADAIILKRFNPKNKGQTQFVVPENTDVVVTDTTCPSEILEQAKKKLIPVVKPEWLVQTIIMGKTVPYLGVGKYCLTEPDST